MELSTFAIVGVAAGAALGIHTRTILNPHDDIEKTAEAERRERLQTRSRGVAQDLTSRATRVVPLRASLQRPVERLLLSAGLGANALGYWWTCELLAVALGLVVGALVPMGDPLRSAGLAVLLGIAFAALPTLTIHIMSSSRKRRISAQLPAALDLMAAVCYAGCTLDEAMRQVASHMEGDLAREFGQAGNDITLGITRQEALHRMAERVDLPELTSVVTSITEAQKTGLGISKVLEEQADAMRVHRSLQIEEYVAKLPVKMLPVMLFCLFSTIPVGILAPYVKGLLDSLTGA